MSIRLRQPADSTATVVQGVALAAAGVVLIVGALFSQPPADKPTKPAHIPTQAEVLQHQTDTLLYLMGEYEAAHR